MIQMGVDKLLQKSMVYFITAFTVIHLLLPFHRASAYDGGLLHLQPLYSGNNIDSGILVSTATDGNLNTTHTIGNRNSQTNTLFYHFGSPVTITAYQLSSASTRRTDIKFYDANKVLIKSIPYSEVLYDGVKHTIEPVSNVSYVALHNVSITVQVVIKEFDVFGFAMPDNTAPAPPSGLTASSTEDVVSLSWKPNTDSDLQGYNVYQSTDNVTFNKINTIPITSTHYVIARLTSGTKYYFAVTAVDTSENESIRSSSVDITPIIDTVPPNEVTNLRVSVTDESIDLTFTNPNDTDFEGTKLYLDSLLKATLNKTSTSYSFVNLNPNTTYTIKVTTFDTKGNESKGVTTTIKTKVPLVGNVTGLQADTKYNRVKLSWTRPDSDFFSHVKIYRKKVEQSFWDQLFSTASVSAATTSDGYTAMFETNGTYWTDLTVKPDTTYSYKVTSVNTEGKESQGVTIETTTPSEPVPKIEGISTTQNEDGDYVVKWTSPTKGTVKVLIGGKEYTVVDAVTQQVIIPKKDMKTNFFGGYDAKLVPVGEFGTEGEAVQVPIVGETKIDFPLAFDDFLKTVVSILAWATPFVLLSLVLIFCRPFIEFLRKTIAKGGRVKQ